MKNLSICQQHSPHAEDKMSSHRILSFSLIEAAFHTFCRNIAKKKQQQKYNKTNGGLRSKPEHQTRAWEQNSISNPSYLTSWCIQASPLKRTKF